VLLHIISLASGQILGYSYPQAIQLGVGLVVECSIELIPMSRVRFPGLRACLPYISIMKLIQSSNSLSWALWGKSDVVRVCSLSLLDFGITRAEHGNSLSLHLLHSRVESFDSHFRHVGKSLRHREFGNQPDLLFGLAALFTFECGPAVYLGRLLEDRNIYHIDGLIVIVFQELDD
jgi:hypothetical protein